MCYFPITHSLWLRGSGTGWVEFLPAGGADGGVVAGLRGLLLRKVEGKSKVRIPEGKKTITKHEW